MTAQDIREFIDSQTVVAKLVSLLLREVGDTEADETIAFVAGGGLERDPRAVTVAKREYTSYLLRCVTPDYPTAETAVESWVAFYKQLGDAMGGVVA